MSRKAAESNTPATQQYHNVSSSLLPLDWTTKTNVQVKIVLAIKWDFIYYEVETLTGKMFQIVSFVKMFSFFSELTYFVYFRRQCAPQPNKIILPNGADKATVSVFKHLLTLFSSQSFKGFSETTTNRLVVKQ